MATVFRKLNDSWNAEPNAPDPQVCLLDGTLLLVFNPNHQAYPDYANVAAIVLASYGCSRYRLGPTNDEGWHRGHCRFSDTAPEWGEFYEVDGDLRLSEPGIEWTDLGVNPSEPQTHYLFYFRDLTFECDADSWSKTDVA